MFRRMISNKCNVNYTGLQCLVVGWFTKSYISHNHNFCVVRHTQDILSFLCNARSCGSTHKFLNFFKFIYGLIIGYNWTCSMHNKCITMKCIQDNSKLSQSTLILLAFWHVLSDSYCNLLQHVFILIFFFYYYKCLSHKNTWHSIKQLQHCQLI